MADTVDLSYSDTGPVAGSEPPIIILHGLFGSKRNWGAIAKVLSQSRRVFCLDLRNHGESPWSDRMDYGAMADDVAAFIDGHAGGHADVIGHSMGGKAAMILALYHPDKVRYLTVVDIAPAPSPGTFIHYIKALKAMDLSRVSSRKEADAQLASTEANPGIRAFLLQNLESDDGGFTWRVNLDVLAARMADLLGFPDPGARTFGNPTLFIAGGASTYVTPGHHDAINGLFPIADIEIMPGVGHWAHAEAPDLFLSLVQAFLQQPK